MQQRAAVFAAGSSPRVRGTRRRRHPLARARRFIPACAGNSHQRPHDLGPAPRFIPACAGNSLRGVPVPTSPPVHPRVCGELRRPPLRAAICSGSSPRVRGTRCWWRQAVPTCPVHPRVCGELELAKLRTLKRDRFIPACAGNSRACRVQRSLRPVHPRVCGELDDRRGGRHRAAGSSPRVRGTQESADRRAERPRFIPACAGNSPSLATPALPRSVHPRVCGELESVAFRLGDDLGSSPRVRGTRAERVSFEMPSIGSSPRVRGTRTPWHG